MKVNITPLEYRVLVLPDTIDDKLGEGLIVKADQTKVTDRRTQTKGEIVALSDVAFKNKWKGRKPKIGERVEYAMYSGQFYKEGETEYRIMNDADIIGILKE